MSAVSALQPRRSLIATYREKVSRRLARHLVRSPCVMGNSGPLVSVTFDDAPDSAHGAGAAILEKYGARGTFYISGALAGTAQPDWRLMNADHVRDLARRGHEIGCHTFTHRAAQALSAVEMEDELARNRAFFAALGDLAIENFAFPYGSVSPARKRQVHRHFRSCRAVTGGINVGTVDLALVRAIPLTNSRIDPEAVARRLDETVSRNGWLVFYTHDVATAPTTYGCTPELLELAVAGARARGCAVVTVREALDRIGAPAMR